MRVSTAFNRLLSIPGATVTEVTIAEDVVEATLRPRARLMLCPCGKRFRSFYDRRQRRWRHLDLAGRRLWLAQRTDRTTVATLMRCAWDTVTAIITRGVAELLDQRRLQTLYRIGVDEICYRHPQPLPDRCRRPRHRHRSRHPPRTQRAIAHRFP